MAFHLRREQRPTTGGLDGTVVILEETAGTARVEIWPTLGFNGYRWQVAWNGTVLDLLYADPHLFDNGRPTRSGIPVLFPFPNRIRAGRYVCEGCDYRLPLNDSTLQNAIHGFACRKPWRLVEQGSDEHSAWLTGEFQGSVDAPESSAHWPADYRIRLTYRLQPRQLRLEALVENPDRVAMPFGLGYHPYFRVPLTPAGRAEDCWIDAPASALWELADSLPTGTCLPVDPARDLRQPRPYPDLSLDDVLTNLETSGAQRSDGLLLRGCIRQAPEQLVLQVWTSPSFRQLVAFTPPHRQAVCLEPYTCATDAINLQRQGIDAGLMVLAPGQAWSGVVELSLDTHPAR